MSEKTRFPVAIMTETQINIRGADLLLSELNEALEADNDKPLKIMVHAWVNQGELARFTELTPVEAFAYEGSDQYGWAVLIRAEDLLDCEREGNSPQMYVMQALNGANRKPKDRDTITPEALLFLAELLDEANLDLDNIKQDEVAEIAADRGITLESLALPDNNRQNTEQLNPDSEDPTRESNDDAG